MDNSEMLNLINIIHIVAESHNSSHEAVRAIWRDLRIKTGSPASNCFERHHIHVIVKELQRIINLGELYQQYRLSIEGKIFKDWFEARD